MLREYRRFWRMAYGTKYTKGQGGERGKLAPGSLGLGLCSHAQGCTSWASWGKGREILSQDAEPFWRLLGRGEGLLVFWAQLEGHWLAFLALLAAWRKFPILSTLTLLLPGRGAKGGRIGVEVLHLGSLLLGLFKGPFLRAFPGLEWWCHCGLSVD